MSDIDSLEGLLADVDIGGTNVDTEHFKISDVVSELDKVLNISAFYAKGHITKRNLRGILRALSYQNYLFERYGFRIMALDTLIGEKIQRVLSVDGKGRKEIIDMVAKGTLKIDAHSGVTVADRLVGGPR